MKPEVDLMYLFPVTVNYFAGSQFFLDTIQNSLLLLIKQDHLHQTAILVPVLFIVHLFLRIKITLNLNRRPIRVEIQDSPSETLLILSAASFLLPPVLFWKVLVIVTASSPWLDRLSGVFRRSHQAIRASHGQEVVRRSNQAIELLNRAPAPVNQIPAEAVIDIIGPDDQAHGIIQPEDLEAGYSTEIP